MQIRNLIVFQECFISLYRLFYMNIEQDVGYEIITNMPQLYVSTYYYSLGFGNRLSNLVQAQSHVGFEIK